MWPNATGDAAQTDGERLSELASTCLVLRQLFVQFLLIWVCPDWTVPILSTVETDSVGIGKVPFPLMVALAPGEGVSDSDRAPHDWAPEDTEGRGLAEALA